MEVACSLRIVLALVSDSDNFSPNQLSLFETTGANAKWESNGPRSSTALNVYVVPRTGTSGNVEPSTRRGPHNRSDGGAAPMPGLEFGLLEFD